MKKKNFIFSNLEIDWNNEIGHLTLSITSLNKEIKYYYRELEKFHNISIMESIYLIFIDEHHGITQYSLAKLINTDRKLIIKYITNMEKKELIVKKSTGRWKHLFLTDLGKEKLEIIYKERALLHKLIKDQVGLEKIIKLFKDIDNFKTIMEDINGRNHFVGN